MYAAKAKTPVEEDCRMAFDGRELSTGDGTDPSVSPTNTKLSKNAHKRMLRRERFLATRAEWRAKMKAKKKLRREETKRAKEALGANKLHSDCVVQERPMISHPDARAPCGMVIIDLSFEALMSDKEINSLVAQICRCYSINRRSIAPFEFRVLGLSGKTVTELARAFPDYERWDVKFGTSSLEEYLGNDPQATVGKDKVVYLSADADETLDRIEDDVTYIIGGLVDRNRHKKVAAQRASNLGLKTAKLPLGEHVRLKCSQVLTIVHVFQILSRQRETGSWSEAILSAIPDRKQAR